MMGQLWRKVKAAEMGGALLALEERKLYSHGNVDVISSVKSGIGSVICSQPTYQIRCRSSAALSRPFADPAKAIQQTDSPARPPLC